MLAFCTNLVLWSFKSGIWPYYLFCSNRQLPVILDRQGSIHGRVLFLWYINDVPDDAICNTAIYADDTTLNS